MKQRRPFFMTFLLPAALVAAIFAAAMFNILEYSFLKFIPGSADVGGLTLDNFARVNKPIYFWALLDTFILSIATAFLALILSYPISFALVRVENNWVRSIIVVLAITPLFTGEIVRTYSWMLVLGTDGVFNSTLRGLGIITSPLEIMYTRSGVIIALVQFAMPVMIILLATAISQVDRNCERAAANLGAPPNRVFWRITIPLTMPGILSGFVVVFAWTMSAFSTPQLIGGGKVMMISNVVYLEGFSSFNLPFAAALSVIALVAALGSLGLMRVATARLERRVAVQ
jgi:putative spermidine/putrescine transport system permease protein